MSISSINLAYGASYGAYNQKLTQATKQQLEELGIAYDKNITEQEGRRLIKANEAQKHQQECYDTPTTHLLTRFSTNIRKLYL